MGDDHITIKKRDQDSRICRFKGYNIECEAELFAGDIFSFVFKDQGRTLSLLDDNRLESGTMARTSGELEELRGTWTYTKSASGSGFFSVTNTTVTFTLDTIHIKKECIFR